MPIALIALLLAADQPYDLNAYRAATRAEVPCDRTAATDEVTVCGQREADRRYRVPFVTTSVRDQVWTERTRLLEDKTAKCGRSAFLTNCGFVGVHVVSGARGTTLKPRKLRED